MANRKKQLMQAVKFTLFSISAGAIELISSALFEYVFGWDYWVSYFIALVLSVLWNFTFNRRYTFKSAKNVPWAMFLVFLYYLVFTPLSIWWGYELEALGIAGILVTVISMLINFVTEFLYQKFVVYRNSEDTNDLAKKDTDESFEKIMDITKTELK